MKNRGQSLPAPHFGAGPTRPACYSPVGQFPRWLYGSDISDIDTTTLESDVNLEARNLSVSGHNCGTLDPPSARPSDPPFPVGQKFETVGQNLESDPGQWRTSRRLPGLPMDPEGTRPTGVNGGVGGARGRWRRSVETTGPTTMNPTRKIFSVPLYIGNMGGV